MDAIEVPCKVNQIPRQVPPQVWYQGGVVSVLMGGILPFGAIFIELFFIFSSLWLHQFYYLFPFLFLVFLILIVTCAEITIVMVYFQLIAEDYRWWWSYIPHFLHTPGYVYAYAFGELLVLALYARYKKEGEAFSEAYLNLLSSGGSNWPHELVAPLGVDLRDPTFWADGVAAIGEMVSEAERLAAELSA